MDNFDNLNIEKNVKIEKNIKGDVHNAGNNSNDNMKKKNNHQKTSCCMVFSILGFRGFSGFVIIIAMGILFFVVYLLYWSRPIYILLFAVSAFLAVINCMYILFTNEMRISTCNPVLLYKLFIEN